MSKSTHIPFFAWGELEVGAGLPGEAELGPGDEAAACEAAEDDSRLSDKFPAFQ